MKYRIKADLNFEVEADSRAGAYVAAADKLSEAQLPGFDLATLNVSGPVKAGDAAAAKSVPEVLGEFAAAFRDGKTRIVGPASGDAFAPGTYADGEKY